MKILFLDIDGVMNCQETAGLSCKYRIFDREPTRLLSEILAKTETEVVISSSWRIGISIKEFKEIFHRQGLPGDRIIGYTPRLYHEGRLRGDEIKLWLEQNASPDAVYAILDDSDDMGELIHRLVQTNYRIGLTGIVAERIIALLR